MDTHYVETFHVGNKSINISDCMLRNTLKTLQNWGKFSEPEEFHIAHLFPCVWKLITLIMMILLAEQNLFQTLLCSDKHIFVLV